MTDDDEATHSTGADATGQSGSQHDQASAIILPHQPPQPNKADARAARIDRTAPLIAVVAGLIIAGLVAVAAIIAATDNAQKVAAAAFTVIGSIVGAYFGVKVGADGTQKAVAAQRAEAARAQVFAAHLPPESAKDILDRADLAASRAQNVPPPFPLPGSQGSD